MCRRHTVTWMKDCLWKNHIQRQLIRTESLNRLNGLTKTLYMQWPNSECCCCWWCQHCLSLALSLFYGSVLIGYLYNTVICAILRRILGNFPNTYAFTKCLSEALVVEQMEEMPAVIMRPSIVIPIRYEPIPGWTDNINGPTGLLIGAGKGVLRSMYCNPSTYGDYLPVDYAVNGIMVSSWNFVYNKWAHFFLKFSHSIAFIICSAHTKSNQAIFNDLV